MPRLETAGDAMSKKLFNYVRVEIQFGQMAEHPEALQQPLSRAFTLHRTELLEVVFDRSFSIHDGEDSARAVRSSVMSEVWKFVELTVRQEIDRLVRSKVWG